MSDTEPQSPDSPKPTTKTSTVPLKKETVRITLRARPEESGPVAPKGGTAPVPAKGATEPVAEPPTATAPVADSGDTGPTEAVAPAAPAPPPPAPAAPTPPPAPAAPAAPAAPPPATPAPAPPPAPSGAPPVGAKTIPLAKKPAGAAPAGAPVGAKTIPLAKAPAAGGPATGRQTTPLTPGGGGAKPLPKATVKLQKTQPMSGEGGLPEKTISQAPDIKSTASDVEEEWEEDFEEGGLVPFAIIVLLLAITVLVIQFMTKQYQPPA